MSYLKSGIRPREERSKVDYALEIENLLAVLTSQIAKAEAEGDPASARVKAVRMLSESVGMIVLSLAVAETNPALSDEILQATGRT